jgi:hypothetical protein
MSLFTSWRLNVSLSYISLKFVHLKSSIKQSYRKYMLQQRRTLRIPPYFAYLHFVLECSRGLSIECCCSIRYRRFLQRDKQFISKIIITLKRSQIDFVVGFFPTFRSVIEFKLSSYEKNFPCSGQERWVKNMQEIADFKQVK